MPAQFPGRILHDGYAESRRSNVLRTQMESGPPKHRRQLDRVLHRRSIRLLLTGAEIVAFETWFETEANQGAAWFDFRDAVEAANGDPIRQARVVGGELGELTWLNHWKAHAIVEFAVEFYV